MKYTLKKVFVLVLLLSAIVMISGCGKKSNNDTLVVNVGPNPDTIDPALNSAVDGATLIVHAFSGLIGYQQDANGQLQLVPELAQALPTKTVLDGGKVQYVFTLRDGLKWSDGSKLDAKDFEYSWKRAASQELAADYSYMFDVIDGYGTANKDDLNVKASADGKTLTVVLKSDVPYFYELCAFPAYMPVKQSIVDAHPDDWATKVSTYVGNGPYKLVQWTANSKMVYEKNPYYYNADAIKIKKIEFALSDDDGAILANYKNGTYKFIDSVPNEEISSLKTQYPNEFVVAGQLGTYYLVFNVNDNSIYGNIATTEEQRQKVREALSLLLDRNYIVNDIGKAGQLPANSFVPIGLTEPDGSQFTAHNGYNEDGTGYYSVADADYAANCQKAVDLLKEVGYNFDESTGKFTNFPTFEYLYNTGTGHAAIAAYIQSALANYGITMTTSNQEWQTFLNTRKDGDYALARDGWLADYNDPISFLDMWTTDSGNNDAQFGRGANANVAIYGPNHDQTWAQSYDALIAQIKATSDANTRFTLMHQAENQLMSTGAIMPVYFYTDIYMISPDIHGFFASPLGYKFFMYATLDNNK